MSEDVDLDEADWAMMYADERKIRLHLEQRIKALIFEAIPLISAADEMIQGMLETDATKTKDRMSKVTQFSADLGANLFLHIFTPPGGGDLCDGLSKEDRYRITHGDLSLPQLKHIHGECQAAAQVTEAEWTAYARKNGLCTADDIAQTNVREYQDIMKQTKRKIRMLAEESKVEH